MDYMTLPAICAALKESRPRIERIVFQYADQLPAPGRIGNARVWPKETMERIRDIIAREARCAGGVQ